ncbi:MAG TPA: cation:proton antiporter [Methanomicrobia archaeon]|nr:cation:proton antiporter [Methanomicrobia archaeon]
MIGIIEIIVVILLAAGVFFMLTGAIGLLRFPDFYTRLHATGKCDTLGEVLIIAGLLLHHFFVYSSVPGAELSVKLVPVKLLFLIVFIFLANPTATHAIMKAAYNTGEKPWEVGEERK